MSASTSAYVSGPAPGGSLGVMDAVRMGWRLLMSDFWMLWLLALVLAAIMIGVGFVSCLLCCLAPLVAFFAQPPLAAGLFKAIKRRVDGAKVDFADLFAAFSPMYLQTVLAGLPVMAIDTVMQMSQTGVRLAAQFAEPISREMRWREGEMVVLLLVAVGVALLVMLALLIVRLFFTFALLAIWDRQDSGVEAIKISMRIVKEHFWSVLGLTLLFVPIGIGAALVGVLACVVGLLITIPAVTMWYKITLVYLYRSWTGQPLVQPAAEVVPPMLAGPQGDAAPPAM
ncbi:MAG: hypothetical protein IMZ44_00555 [Planctomycetes bacterium]|nr:hypothetical protein [Planctomycetota bacterium]